MCSRLWQVALWETRIGRTRPRILNGRCCTEKEKQGGRRRERKKKGEKEEKKKRIDQKMAKTGDPVTIKGVEVRKNRPCFQGGPISFAFP